VTDRAPYEYRYLSRRLLTDVIKNDEASRGRRLKLSTRVGLSPVTVDIGATESDRTSMQAFARRAVDLVSDHTTDLDADPAGPYVMCRVALRFGLFEALMGWPGGTVACYAGEHTTVAGERVYLALFGSGSNVVGFRDADGTGYYPSDLDGLYALLDLVREDDDPAIDYDYRWDDARYNDQVRAETAVKFADGGARTPIGAHDMLARIFVEVEHLRVNDQFAGRVLVGTPLWVATPHPTPLGAGQRGQAD
jgi:hypothetical protein